jgi:hypothetical protein
VAAWLKGRPYAVWNSATLAAASLLPKRETDFAVNRFLHKKSKILPTFSKIFSAIFFMDGYNISRKRDKAH